MSSQNPDPNAMWRNPLIWYDLLLAILSIILIFDLAGERKQPFVLHADILVPVQTPVGSLAESRSHNSALLSILQVRYSSAHALFAAGQSNQMQGRMFFLAVFTLLLSFAMNSGLPAASTFSHQGRLGVQRMTSTWRAIWFALMAFLIAMVMFLLDVHLDDSMRLQRDFNSMTSSAIDRLANSTPSDSTWYVLSYAGLNEVRRLADRTMTHWGRKLRQATYPTGEEKVYFLFPGLAAYCLMRYFTSRRGHYSSHRQK